MTRGSTLTTSPSRFSRGPRSLRPDAIAGTDAGGPRRRRFHGLHPSRPERCRRCRIQALAKVRQDQSFAAFRGERDVHQELRIRSRHRKSLRIPFAPPGRDRRIKGKDVCFPTLFPRVAGRRTDPPPVAIAVRPEWGEKKKRDKTRSSSRGFSRGRLLPCLPHPFSRGLRTPFLPSSAICSANALTGGCGRGYDTVSFPAGS